MKGLKEAVDDVVRELDEKDAVREIALKASRDILRRSKEAIAMMHRAQDPIELLRRIREDHMALISTLREHPELIHAGYVSDASQEFTEAMILYTIFKDHEIPDSRELKVDAGSYAMGLADVVGELRRSVLDHLKDGDINTAELRLSQMEDIQEQLMRLDYPSAIVNIRQKQDMARALIEKTRGEVALSKRLLAVEKKLEK